MYTSTWETINRVHTKVMNAERERIKEIRALKAKIRALRDDGYEDSSGDGEDVDGSSDDDDDYSSDSAAHQNPPPMTATASAALSVLNAPPPGTRGAVFDERWLELVAKTHDPHMGAENLGPALYSLCRFVKPKKILEIGAGYTSLFLLQALRDNDEEMRYLAKEKLATHEPDDKRGGQKAMRGMPPDVMWFDAKSAQNLLKSKSTLHCVDDLSHAFCTAQEVKRTATKLGIEEHLRMYDGDAWGGAPSECLPQSKNENGCVEMLWIDFGVGDRLDEFLKMYWPVVAAGGFVVVHSTVTNKATRAWLERVRCGTFRWLESDDSTGDETTKKRKQDKNEKKSKPIDEVHHVSFLEPHKRYQNAFTVLQKRPQGWGEPVYTDEA